MIVQCAECKTSFRLNDELVPPRTIKVRCSKCGHVFAIDGRDVDISAPEPVSAPSPAASVPPPERFGDLDLNRSASSPAPAADTQAVPPVAPAAGKQEDASTTATAQVRHTPFASSSPTAGGAAAVPFPQAPSAPTAQGSSTEGGDPAAGLELERSQTPPMMGAAATPATPAAPASPAAPSAAAAATAVEAPPATAAGTFRELDLDAPAAAEEKPAAAEDPQQKRQQDKARRLARALVSDILVYNREKRDKALASGNLVQALAGEIKKSWEVYKERVTPEVANSTNHFREALNDILADGQQIF